jgi:hypothetical protein
MAEELTGTALRALVAQWVRAALGELVEEESAVDKGKQSTSLSSPCGTMEVAVTPGELIGTEVIEQKGKEACISLS